MVVCMVRLYPSLAPNALPSARVYALLLPSAEHIPSSEGATWSELSVQRSGLSGLGVFPGHAAIWNDVGETPILLPYFGAETVVNDALSLRLFMAVLKGHFVRVTVGQVVAASRVGLTQARGHFAVPISSEHEQALPLEKMLLQVAASQSGSASAVHYLLAEETRTLLNLVGPQAHLFDLLCVHANDGHVDRHFATHVGTLKRKGEGHVLINAHPAFRDPLSITGSAQLRD